MQQLLLGNIRKESMAFEESVVYVAINIVDKGPIWDILLLPDWERVK